MTGISTSCAEGIGGSGQTGGNGAGAFRYLESSYGTSGEPETVYYSLVARTNPDNPVAEGDLGWYAGASLFNGDAEVLFLGKPWAADSWGFDAQDGACDGDVNGCGFSSVQFSDTPSLIVVKMDFDGVGATTSSGLILPTVLRELLKLSTKMPTTQASTAFDSKRAMAPLTWTSMKFVWADHGTMSFPMTVVAATIAQKTSMETALSASATSSRRCLLGDPPVLQTSTVTASLPSAMCSRCCPHSAPAESKTESIDQLISSHGPASAGPCLIQADQTPCSINCWVTVPDQSRLAAGDAGEG